MDEEDRLCKCCYNSFAHQLKKKEAADSLADKLTLLSVGATHSRGFVCNNVEGLETIDEHAIINLWRTNDIVVPHGNRCCSEHLESSGRKFSDEAIEVIKMRAKVRECSPKMFKETVLEMNKRDDAPMNFDLDSTLKDDYYDTYLGMSKENFMDLCNTCAPFIERKNKFDFRNSIALFLTKLRTGMSLQACGLLFGIDKRRASEKFHMVRKLLMRAFVPSNLGYNSITREDYIQQHGTTLSQMLLQIDPTQRDIAASIMDGTYLYIQKSTNFKVQKQTWSFKNANLVKPFKMVAADG